MGQERLKKKQELLSSMRSLLMKWEFTETASNAIALKEGSHHQQFNKTNNLKAKLNRMDAKDRFMESQNGGSLMESVERKHLKMENERLRQEMEEMRSAMGLLESDKLKLDKALKLKIKRIRQIEEERGIVIGELRISLEGMTNAQRTMKEQMNEEKKMLHDHLKQMVLKLTEENEQLRKQNNGNS